MVTDSLVVTVEYTPPVPLTNDTSVCEAGSVQLLVGGGSTYTWLPAPGITDLDGPDPVVSPLVSTMYYVNVGNSCGLILDSVYVNVQVVVTDAWPDTIICPGESVSLFAMGATLYEWSPAAGLSGTSGSPITASPSSTTTYRVIAASTAGCELSATRNCDQSRPRRTSINSRCSGSVLSVQGGPDRHRAHTISWPMIAGCRCSGGDRSRAISG